MIKTFKNHSTYSEARYLGVLTLMCFTFSAFRFYYADSNRFLFLNWNLFLAFIPWALSNIIFIKPAIQNNRIAIAILLGTWILFFPNAPYILTDLFHLRLQSAMPIWFDLVLILSFAWTGLLFGLFSLRNIERMLMRFMNRTQVTLVSVLLLFLGSLGVYLGRYLRWNSWDILSAPTALLSDVSDRLINPFDHPGTWGMTLFLGLFLNMIYWSFRFIKKSSD